MINLSRVQSRKELPMLLFELDNAIADDDGHLCNFLQERVKVALKYVNQNSRIRNRAPRKHRKKDVTTKQIRKCDQQVRPCVHCDTPLPAELEGLYCPGCLDRTRRLRTRHGLYVCSYSPECAERATTPYGVCLGHGVDLTTLRPARPRIDDFIVRKNLDVEEEHQGWTDNYTPTPATPATPLKESQKAYKAQRLARSRELWPLLKRKKSR